jgi:hypothetical protein
MKIFRKEKLPNGRRHIYFCGIKILSYKKKQNPWQQLYNRRFDENICLDDKKKIIAHQFKYTHGYEPDLENPKTFNEKLQWIKLYDHNPLYTLLSDKYLVRDYIKDKIGEKYLIRLLGVWDNPDDIDFDKLPDKFVLKVNWGSGQNIIVTDKSSLDLNEVREKLRTWMNPRSNLYYYSFEWQYKNIKPKITAEEYLESIDENAALDYKFMCFGGKPFLCWVSNKNKEVHERSFYDMDWNMTDIELLEPGKIMATTPAPKPKNLDEMINIAKILSAGFPEVRVDLYLLPNGDIKFGELTFTSASGYSPWKPASIDRTMGDLIDLSNVKKDA